MTTAAFSMGDAVGAPSQSRRVLLIEDDVGDAMLVEALLEATPEHWVVITANSIASAGSQLDASIACVLVDLGLPDAQGLDALTGVLRMAGSAAVVVLTGLDDERRGAEAVAIGAQDYLVKGQIDGPGLSRALRYAIERKQAEETSHRLREAEMQRRANVRLERGLLPKPLLTGGTIRFASRYRPGGSQIELGGDFYDLLELEDGTVRAVIGDVSGHGPDEAAVGVSLRAAWRALVLGGQGSDRVLGAMQSMLFSEREYDEVFVTCCDLTIAADRSSATVRIAGHPAPLLLGSGAAPLSGKSGPALGLMEATSWPDITVPLGPDWAVLMYTDGLIEGRTADRRTLGSDGLQDLVDRQWAQSVDMEAFVDGLVEEAESMNRAPLSDDVAVLVLTGCRESS